MNRIRAFEFNDSSWVPRFLRESIVESLGTGLRWGKIYDAVGPVFADFVERAHATEVVDLCSGSGEPVAILLDALARAGKKAPGFVVTDLFPNVATMEEVASRHPGVTVVPESVDATDVPAAHDRPARTIMSAFHHFPDDLARRILSDVVVKRRGVFICEGFPRSIFRLPAVMPAMIAATITNPFLCRRDRLLKLLFTIIPVIPLIGLWDAIVSNLRVYSEKDLRGLVEPLGGGYTWEYREVPFFPLGRAVVFLGLPNETQSA